MAFNRAGYLPSRRLAERTPTIQHAGRAIVATRITLTTAALVLHFRYDAKPHAPTSEPPASGSASKFEKRIHDGQPASQGRRVPLHPPLVRAETRWHKPDLEHVKSNSEIRHFQTQFAD